MGTDETGNTREYLRKRLKGTYSDVELDAIAAALEKDPDLLTHVTDPSWDPALAGMEDPTGTVLYLEPHESHMNAGDSLFVDFKIDPKSLEELAQAIARADPQDTMTRIWPTNPQKKQIRAFIPYDDLRGLTEKEREDLIQEEHLNVISRLRDLGCIKMETSEMNNRIEDRVEITGTGYKP